MNLHDIRTSYGRCVVTREQKLAFYGRILHTLIVSGAPVAERLQEMSEERRLEMIKQALNMTILYAQDPDSFAKDVILSVLNRHIREHGPIDADEITHWKAGVLAAVSASDPKFDSPLEKQWETVLDRVIDLLITHLTRREPVQA
jgi:hypothetical protein